MPFRLLTFDTVYPMKVAMIAQQLKLIDKVVIPPPIVSIESVVFTGENERLKDLEKQICHPDWILLS